MAGKKVSSHIKQVCALLKNERPDFQHAAAIVLGELKVKDSFVVRSLGEALNDSVGFELKGHILDAFAKIKSKKSLKHLLPFLFEAKASTEDNEFSNKAVEIVSSLGSESARELKSMLKKASSQERCIILFIFIKMRNLTGLKVILEALQNSDEDVVDEICRMMKEEMQDLGDEQKKSFSSKVEAFLTNKRSRHNRHAISAAIKMLGYIGCADSQITLMSFTTLQNHPSIRCRALQAMRDLSLYSCSRVEIIKKMVSYLDEKDFTNIVSPAMNILSALQLKTRMADMVIKLLDNQHDAVRRFAIKKMRELNSIKVVRVLIDKLSGPDPGVRDLAAESLCWLDSARAVLLDKVLDEEDPELCSLYAKILKPHATKFRSNQVKRLTGRLHKLLDEGNALYEPFLSLIKTVASDYLNDDLFDRGIRFKRVKKYTEALETFKLLQLHGNLNAAGKYEMSVCMLALSPKKPNRQARESDTCLTLFQQLVKEEDFALLEKLKGDKHVGHDGLYYIALHFRGKLQKDREFGNAILEFLVKKHPRSKVGIASRKLLKEAAL